PGAARRAAGARVVRAGAGARGPHGNPAGQGAAHPRNAAARRADAARREAREPGAGEAAAAAGALHLSHPLPDAVRAARAPAAPGGELLMPFTLLIAEGAGHGRRFRFAGQSVAIG